MKLSKNIRLGESSVTTKFGSDSEDVVITFTPYAGAETFSWTLDGSTVDRHGFYWDGTPYVVPTGSHVTVKAVSPAPKEETITGALVNGGAADLTVRYDGVMINPVMGVPQDEATVRAGTYTGSTGGDATNGRAASDLYGLTSDNRVNADLTDDNPQVFMDTYFNTALFGTYKTAFPEDGVAGPGHQLNIGDVMVLTKSVFDATENDFRSQNSRMGATPAGWSPRSGLKSQAFLYVVSQIPGLDDFRPPPQWLTEDDAANGVTGSARPIFTTADLVNLGTLPTTTTQGLCAGIGNSTFLPDGFNTWREVWGAGPSDSKPPVSAFFPAPLLADDGYYSASIAPFNLIPGCDVTYGGDMYIMATGYLMNEMVRSNLTLDDRQTAQKKLVQAGIDCIGAMSCRAAITGGAGQRPGQTTPLALFALRNLGSQITSLGIGGTGIEDLVKWIWDIDTTTWNSLSDVEKRNLRGAQSYEENVCWSLGMMVSEYDGSNSVGHSYKHGWTTSTTSALSITGETALRSGDIISSGTLRVMPVTALSTSFNGTLAAESSGTWAWSTTGATGDLDSASIYSSTAANYQISEAEDTTDIEAYKTAGYETYIDHIYVDIPLDASRYQTSKDWNKFFTITTGSTSILCDNENLLSSISGASLTPVYSDGNSFVRVRVNLVDPSGTSVNSTFQAQQDAWASFKANHMNAGDSVSVTLGYNSTGDTGRYEYDVSADPAGRLDFNPFFPFNGADNADQGTHAGGHTNLIGCTAEVDGTEYYITGVTENVEQVWYDYDAGTPAVRVYLDRPLDSSVSNTTVTIYPFRDGDDGDTDRVYFIREPQTPAKWDWATPSAWNDDYSNKFHTTSAFAYLLMRQMDGDWSKLGNCGILMSQYYGGSDPQCSWQPFNGNEVKKKFGSVSSPAMYISPYSTDAQPLQP